MADGVLTNTSQTLMLWTSVFLNTLLTTNKDPSDEDIERATRIAFIGARSAMALAQGLEESARKPPQ